MHDEELYAERCIRAGAGGYVMKRESSNRVVAAVREVMAGRMCVSEQMAAAFAKKFVSGRKTGGDSPVSALSDRELEVFQLIGSGQGTRRIAAELHLGIKTVESYRARIKEKLKLEDGTQLLQQAIQWVHSLQDHPHQAEG